MYETRERVMLFHDVIMCSVTSVDYRSSTMVAKQSVMGKAGFLSCNSVKILLDEMKCWHTDNIIHLKLLSFLVFTNVL